jgi:hypothetical protein
MAARKSFLRYLTAALVAGFALSLAPSSTAIADDDPGAKRKRPRYVVKAPKATPRIVYRAPRTVQPVRTVVHVRTVHHTRIQRICHDYAGRPFDCRMPAPVAPRRTKTVYVPVPTPAPEPVVQYQAAYTTCGTCVAAPVVVQAPRYYATGCGTCTHSTAAPYYWAVRHSRYRHHARHHHHHH